MGPNGMELQDMGGYSMLHNEIKPMTVAITYELKDENGNLIESGTLKANPKTDNPPMTKGLGTDEDLNQIINTEEP